LIQKIRIFDFRKRNGFIYFKTGNNSFEPLFQSKNRVRKHPVYESLAHLAAVTLFFLFGEICVSDSNMPSSLSRKALHSVEEIRKLSLEEARTNIPVRLEGVITYNEPNLPFAFIQDETAGIYFCGSRFPHLKEIFWPSLKVGDLVHIEGVTDSGNFSPLIIIPEVTLSSVKIAGKTGLPNPLSPSLNNLLQPQLHNQWVELNATLTEFYYDRGLARFKMNIGGFYFDVSLPVSSPKWEPPDDWMYSEINLTGVYEARFNKEKQMVTFKINVPSLDHFKPVQSKDSRLFDGTPVSPRELLTFSSPARALVKGVVLIHLPGDGFYMRSENDTGGLWVQADIEKRLMPGREVSAVGQPTLTQTHPYLKDSVVQLGVQRRPPKPRRLDSLDPLSVDFDGDLIAVKARLVESIIIPRSILMVIRVQDTLLTVQCNTADNTQDWKTLTPGSWIEFTGVFIARGEGLWTPITPDRTNLLARTPYSFSLLLRDFSDVRIVHVPSWWTIKRITVLAAFISVLAVAAFIWVLLLRSRVRQQTNLISMKIKQESIQEERARIARDLHDTLQQNLTGIMLQINNAQNRLTVSPDTVSSSLKTAHSMAKHSFEEVEYTVWNLHSSSCIPAKIRPALREMLNSFMLHQSGPALTIHTSGPEVVLPGVVLSQVLNIVREAVTNVIRHANAKTLDISVHTSSTVLEITIKDDGVGFVPTKKALAERSHFGLISMKERAGKINASVDILSEPGKGTNVFFSLELTKTKTNNGARKS
jgi:signal transduction histidine kinase